MVAGYKCKCPRGFYGPRCQSDVNECASDPCRNGGVCENGFNEFICKCKDGYEGKRCENQVDLCKSNPCQHGGQCNSFFNSYSCQCQPGFEGKNCEVNTDDCLLRPCQNDGTCIDHINDFRCVCQPPFTGKTCEEEMDPCIGNNCSNGATCSPTSNYKDYTCSCPLGFTGRFCQEDIDECAVTAPCRNGGKCINTPGSYTCQCRDGFEGRDCLINIDDCADKPCLNGGTCLDETDGFKCLCVDGFGGELCQKDIDECQSQPCLNGATCTDYVNSYTCTCRSGFSGTNCEINDEDCTPSSCLNGGSCIDGINNYTCICAIGFTGSNCQLPKSRCDNNPCKNSGVCIDDSENGGYYTCQCASGWTGNNCEKIVDWCRDSPCENGARCLQRGTSFQCECQTGWTGKLCDVRQVPCKAAAIYSGLSSAQQLCQNGGYCRDIGSSHQCICAEGYQGSYCQDEIDECGSNPCQNGATCRDLIATYQCDCPKGFQGKNCEYNINDCLPNRCQNNGICYDLVDDFKCACPHGTMGDLCEINVNECFEGACHHGGTCIDKIGGYECKCPAGYVGPRCEGDVNECLSNPCSSLGTQECIQLVNNYNCVCRPGWMGRNCETRRNFCQGNPCQNGGVCTNQEGSHQCACTPGYYGGNCQFTGTPCDGSPCRNGGTCVDSNDGTDFGCRCPAGTTGKTCEQDTRNECTYNPCQNKGHCIDKVGDYDCSCQPEWRGKNCDISDRASPGGVDKSNGRYVHYDTYEEKQKCIEYECDRKAGDNRCDEECNTHACNYDGLDCRLGINPWKYCNATSRGGKSCWEVFEDGRCDEACNSKECLFDGRDCEAGTKMECNPNYDVYCSDHFGNGRCDLACNNAACGWDGLDCEPVSEHHEIIPGSFYVVLTMTISQFDDAMQKRFERYLSLTLRTSFKIRRNSDGSPMVFDFNPASSVPAETGDSGYAFNTNLVLQGNMGIIVYLEVDNVKCQQESADYCYHDAEGYANLFSAMIGTGKLKDEWGILQVGASEEDEDGSNGPSIGGIAVGVVILIGMIFVVNMMVNKKKRARGIQWFPENFTLTGGSSGLHGGRKRPRQDHQQQEMLGFGSNSGSQRYASTLDIDRWSDDDPHEQARKKGRLDYCSSSDRQTIISNDYENDSDSRPWTQQHINAADIRNPEILACALTPPQGEVLQNEMMTNDVNGRGPMGMTPLMIASFRGTGVDNGDIENFESNADLEGSSTAITQDLISQKADLKATMDKTGETALHLAARWARADTAKLLLDAGDDAIANAQDHTGRTPLHAAVAADAQGVFHILLKNRYTTLDAKTYDGTTPLMLAVRMAIEGVPEALMEAGADVNIADENGKTALHWAAAVNNVDAVNTLLKNNANRDAQDHKDETPLFLAAREGSFQAAKALLDHGANREIQDHMDRLPLTVAQERRCSQVHGMAEDIVNLLETYPSPSQMPGGMHPFSSQPMLSGGSPPGLMQMPSKNPHHSSSSMHRMKKPAVKKASGNGMMPHHETDSNSVLSSCTLPRGSGQHARQSRPGSIKQTISKAQIKKTDSSSMMLSPEHSPYEPQGSFISGGAQHLALSHPNLEDLVNKPPPSYEAALANHHSLQGGMPGQQSLEGQYYHQQQPQIHNRQQSMPASVSSTYSNHLSPPHSNLSSHHNGQSPSHSTGVMSPPNAAVMSPPQSVTMSPPQSTMQNSVSPPLLQQQQQLRHHASSPIKSRSTQLPTSPTHMAAMRGATHQRRHQASFDFGNDHQAQNQQQMYMNRQNQFLYPTPPQEQGGHNNSFLSPSPDSPDQWSSASPQSHSDWSEGIHSPPSVMNGGGGHFQHPQHLQQHQMINQQTTDAVII